MADFKKQAGRGWTAHGPTSHQWTKVRKRHGERRWQQDSAKVETGQKITAETHVRCPYCRELVRNDARKCKHCGTALVPQ
ncbi:zinc ribbon domain-containing protein [Acidovorax sp. A1169]|uniref:zinc ribbon domain-containing protein n=1 Tax=Acidovorax sp. A1169 TaxID=3059524 RepID=UPI0035215839